MWLFVVPFVIRSPSIVKKNSENTICEQCQDNLNLIQSILQDYIPDESVSQAIDTFAIQ